MSLRWTEDDFIEYLMRMNKCIKEPKKQKTPKYNNKRTRADGILFDSKMEAEYYSYLKLQLSAGEIKGFCRQPKFILVEGFADQRPITYSADFIVFNLDGTAEVIDVKGMETEQWNRTKKMFQAKFPRMELKMIRDW